MNLRKLAVVGLTLSTLLSCVTDTTAQNLNNGNCGQITNAGTIRFRSRDARFSNSNTPSRVNNNNGVIEFRGIQSLFTGPLALGANATARIGGLVLWSAIVPQQYVQPRFYTNLGISGGTKFLSDSTFIGGQYQIANGTGNRSYTGVLYYDGTIPQTVVAEHGVNSYDALELRNAALNSAKILRGDTATVRTEFTNHSSNSGGFVINNKGVLNILASGRSQAPLNVDGNGSSIEVRNDEAHFFLGNNSTMQSLNGGSVNVFSQYRPAALVVPIGATFRVVGSANDGQFHLGAFAAMNVGGQYLNTSRTLLNAFYECSSIVRYIAVTNDQIMQASAEPATHRYGVLETLGGSKVANGDVHVGCGVHINTGSTPHIVRMDNNRKLVIHNENSSLTPVLYDSSMSDCLSASEVIGTVEQRLPSRLNQEWVVFNNRMTRIRFADSVVYPERFAINAQALGFPNNFDANRDVRRKLTVQYTSPRNGNLAWNATVRAAFRQIECAQLRSSGNLSGVRSYDDPSANTVRKIGDYYSRSLDSTCAFNWLEAQHISSTGPNQLTNGADFLLRSAPALISSVRSGRWSNPATWSDGSEPMPFDSVIINHNVWAGFVRPQSNGWDGFVSPERYPNALCSSVRIATPDSSRTTAALVFGLDKTAPANSGLFRFGNTSNLASTLPGRGATMRIIECNSGEMAGTSIRDFNEFANVATTRNAPLHGLVIFTVDGKVQPKIHVNTLDNQGWIQNGSELEVGD